MDNYVIDTNVMVVANGNKTEQVKDKHIKPKVSPRCHGECLHLNR